MFAHNQAAALVWLNVVVNVVLLMLRFVDAATKLLQEEPTAPALIHLTAVPVELRIIPEVPTADEPSVNVLCNVRLPLSVPPASGK